MKYKFVFLHIPKTAGQTIHSELARVIGKARTSPVRVHTQAMGTCFPSTEKYDLFSGHIDWLDLAEVPHPRVVFSVLRDPIERIASFYYYLLGRAKLLSDEELSRPENHGLRRILDGSADDYFCGSDPAFINFIDDHYNNFYTYYFSSKQIRGFSEMRAIPIKDVLEKSVSNSYLFDRISSIRDLAQLQAYLTEKLETRIDIVNNRVNTSNISESEDKVSMLCSLIQSEKTISRLISYISVDVEFMKRIGMESECERSLRFISEVKSI